MELLSEVSDQQRLALLGTSEAHLTNSTTLRLSAMHQKDKRTPFWGVPSHEDGYLLNIDRSTFLASTYGRLDIDYTMYSGGLTHQFDNGWTGKIMANYFNHYKASALKLLTKLQDSQKVSYLFVTHDLRLVERFADRILVMEDGRFVEEQNNGDIGGFLIPHQSNSKTKFCPPYPRTKLK